MGTRERHIGREASIRVCVKEEDVKRSKRCYLKRVRKPSIYGLGPSHLTRARARPGGRADFSILPQTYNSLRFINGRLRFTVGLNYS